MGSKFIEKHKRKSLLAALLFIFQGRAKYVGMLLVVTVLSVPFVVSSETLSRMVQFQPVASFLHAVGLGSVVSAINPDYSNDVMKAAIDRAASSSKSNSFWQKFLNRISATMPPGGGASSLAMIRGDNSDIFGPPEIRDGRYDNAGPGEVKGVVNEEERNRGEGVDGVDLQGLIAGVADGAAGEGQGLYGDLMGQNLAGNFAGGSASANGPYANRVMLGKRGGAASGGSAAMYSNVMGQSGSRVPTPNSPGKVKTKKKLGHVSGFAWRNIGYKNRSATIGKKLGTKKPMFQLAETFAMTAAGAKNKDSAYEYQASYVGSTYDGNDASADVIETGFDTAPTVPPDTSFIDGMITDAQGAQQLAKDCSDAQGTHGAKMSEDGKKIDEISKTLGSPPKCCSSRVSSWNSKIENIKATCQDFNVHEAAQAAACQITSSPMDCSSYNSMKIKKCSKWKCWLAVFLMIFLGFLFFGLIGAIVVGVLASSAAFGGGGGFLGEIIGGFISKLAGGE